MGNKNKRTHVVVQAWGAMERKEKDKIKRHSDKVKSIREGIKDFYDCRHIEKEVEAEICVTDGPCDLCRYYEKKTQEQA